MILGSVIGRTTQLVDDFVGVRHALLLRAGCARLLCWLLQNVLDAVYLLLAHSCFALLPCAPYELVCVRCEWLQYCVRCVLQQSEQRFNECRPQLAQFSRCLLDGSDETEQQVRQAAAQCRRDSHMRHRANERMKQRSERQQPVNITMKQPVVVVVKHNLQPTHRTNKQTNKQHTQQTHTHKWETVNTHEAARRRQKGGGRREEGDD